MQLGKSAPRWCIHLTGNHKSSQHEKWLLHWGRRIRRLPQGADRPGCCRRCGAEAGCAICTTNQGLSRCCSGWCWARQDLPEEPRRMDSKRPSTGEYRDTKAQGAQFGTDQRGVPLRADEQISQLLPHCLLKNRRFAPSRSSERQPVAEPLSNSSNSRPEGRHRSGHPLPPPSR